MPYKKAKFCPFCRSENIEDTTDGYLCNNCGTHYEVNLLWDRESEPKGSITPFLESKYTDKGLGRPSVKRRRAGGSPRV